MVNRTASSVSVSPEGVKFICGFEGFVPYPYRDTGGVLTIGYGITINEFEAKKYAKGITEEQGHQMMADYLVSECRELSQMPLAGFHQYQQDAIVSLCYNIGFHAFVNSTIYKRIYLRSIDLSPWTLWIKDKKGTTLQDLVQRRQKELKLFIYGIYS